MDNPNINMTYNNDIKDNQGKRNYIKVTLLPNPNP